MEGLRPVCVLWKGDNPLWRTASTAEVHPKKIAASPARGGCIMFGAHVVNPIKLGYNTIQYNLIQYFWWNMLDQIFGTFSVGGMFFGVERSYVHF